MLDMMYRFATPWAVAGKIQIMKNRGLGFLANVIYPIYCKVRPVQTKKKAEGVIVSLTTYPARVGKIYLCINSILRQKVQAEKVILWLADTQFSGKEELPQELLKLQEYGLEIRFCDDLRSYKKVFYTAQEYAGKIIITADDDTLYPESWIERLLESYREHPECVCCYRAHRITMEHNKLLPYKRWVSMSPGETGPSQMLLPVGVGGVLYPGGYFDGIDFDYGAIREVCPTADDLWLKSIGLKKGIPAVKVDPYSKEWFTIRDSQKDSLTSVNTRGENLNDTAMKNLVRYYKIDLASIDN